MLTSVATASKVVYNKGCCISENLPVIGLPKGLFYYEHSILWESFFKILGFPVITSEDTNKEILDNGIIHCSNETCLPVKVFHGHVYSLKDKTDYIFIPRYTSIDKNEYTCPKFCGLPDMALLNLKNKIKVLEVKLHIDKDTGLTFESLKEIARILGVNYQDTIEAFQTAIELFHEKKQEISRVNCYNQVRDLKKRAVSVLGHPYVIYDSYLSMKLIKKLKEKDIDVYTPLNLDHKTKRHNAYPYQGKAFWEVGFENLGSAFTYAQDKNMNGIIYLSPFACGVDAFIIEFIERQFKDRYKVPFLKLTIDEHTGEAGFDTRVEAFLDMIG